MEQKFLKMGGFSELGGNKKIQNPKGFPAT
jgi:hypothetical protein